MVEAGLDYFFDRLKWVFNVFLIQIKILDIPLLYYFFALIILSIVISALINTSNAGRLVVRSSRKSGKGGSDDSKD